MSNYFGSNTSRDSDRELNTAELYIGRMLGHLYIFLLFFFLGGGRAERVTFLPFMLLPSCLDSTYLCTMFGFKLESYRDLHFLVRNMFM